MGCLPQNRPILAFCVKPLLFQRRRAFFRHEKNLSGPGMEKIVAKKTIPRPESKFSSRKKVFRAQNGNFCDEKNVSGRGMEKIMTKKAIPRPESKISSRKKEFRRRKGNFHDENRLVAARSPPFGRARPPRASRGGILHER